MNILFTILFFIVSLFIYLSIYLSTCILDHLGTLSLEDCITDVTCEAESLQQAGVEYGFEGRGKYAHKGMLHSALHIRRQIDELNVLQSLMNMTGDSGSGGNNSNIPYHTINV